MSNTSDKQVLNQILNYKNNVDSTVNLPEYPFLDLDYVETISNTIGDIVYDSYTNHTRDTIIELISKWTRPNSHFPIDDTNIDIFINIFKHKPDLKIDDLSQFSVNPTDLGPASQLDYVLDTLNKKYKINLENKIKSELIQTWNVTQFKNSNFEFNAPNIQLQNPDVEKTIEYLQNLKLNQTSVQKIVNMEIEDNCLENINISIELGYALLKYPKTPQIENLFMKIIKNISNNKTDETIKFVNYLWENKDIKPLSFKIYEILFENFAFLYEKIVINSCTMILQNLRPSRDVFEYEMALIAPDLQAALEICNKQLLINILAILNKLLILSKMDKRLLIFYELFIQKYMNK